MTEKIKVSYKIICECWSDGQVLVTGEPKLVPREAFFNAAASIISTIVEKSQEPLDEVMDHVLEHVLASKRTVKQ